MMAVALVGALLSAAAAPRTVAVLSFVDLSGANNAIGEGIRETVTLELTQCASLKVVERAQVDQVLHEQQRLYDDASRSAQVGKTLGAQLVVVGAFQQMGSQARLTARFVDTATTQIVGTAKVDGPVRDLLRLQDRVAAELLRTAGASPAMIASVAEQPRPPLNDLAAVDLFGQASRATDDAQRRALLTAVVRLQPDYPHAPGQLAAIETRLKAITAQAEAAQLAAITELEAQLKTLEGEPRLTATVRLASQLTSARRVHRAIALYRDEEKALVGKTDQVSRRWSATFGCSRLMLQFQVEPPEAVWPEAEAFLKTYADEATWFAAVKHVFERSLADAKRGQAGVIEADAWFRSERDRSPDWNLCSLGREFESRHSYEKARRLYQACLDTGGDARERALEGLLSTALPLRDWSTVRAAAAQLAREAPVAYERHRLLVDRQVPLDD